MKKGVLFFTIMVAAVFAVFSAARGESTQKLKVKVLLLPKFENGEMSGDFPGEAQFYHEAYTSGGTVVKVADRDVYYKDGVALVVTGMGKVNAGLTAFMVMTSDVFDCTEAIVISTGCAGGAVETTTMGDVVLPYGAVDFDLGHHLDSLEIPQNWKPEDKWIHGPYDSSAFVKLNQNLVDAAAAFAKDAKIATTDKTRSVLNNTFNGASWAIRDPKIIVGGAVASGDNYWKGPRDEAVAKRIAKEYGGWEYYMTEMEDVAIGIALKRLGALDRYLIIRDSVNMDVFIGGMTAASWKKEEESGGHFREENAERADIFRTAMANNFTVGKPIVDAILRGDLK